ncbi:probable E3 ubiquitin-protein ligase ATL44 [Zingiber officinale]|uniref:probable E3 ubiquitin-protein ligase ATL44 n=1 Tax=Zingiber officinale TaxID=94328 RepID=UPI001C4AC180|nr:probable E3 ubiquitin-protein ligase ATL44 [Zingiber officinale]
MSLSSAARRLVACPPPPAPAPTAPTDFASTMVLISALIYVAVYFVIAVAFFVRHHHNHHNHRNHREEELTPEKVSAAMAAMQVPLVLFSAATTKLAWSAKRCSICLMEFAEGDALRVLPACSHGFHGQCVERWLASKGSCPNCRRRVRNGVRRGCLPDVSLLV